MQYIDLGKTGLRVSRFGMGCMRFPEDENEAIELVRYALDNGVNYLDTAYAYGNSEEILGKALKDGYREKAVLATKCPVWLAESHDDFEKFLDEELIRLKTDVIDVYLLHNLGVENWELVEKYDGLSFLDKMVKKGKIKHKAFSFHGTYDHFVKVIDAYDWEMAQIQLNILDMQVQAGVKGLKIGADKGIPMVIMEPLRGGGLVDKMPDKVKNLLNEFPNKRSIVEWAFRWLYSMEETSVILSGVSSMDQLKQNISIFSEAEYNVMSDEDNKLIVETVAAFKEQYLIPCTYCNYCMPCPYGVEIPEIFDMYNISKSFDQGLDAIIYKQNFINTKKDAGQCTECNQCVSLCPQSIAIPDELKKAHLLLK